MKQRVQSLLIFWAIALGLVLTSWGLHQVGTYLTTAQIAFFLTGCLITGSCITFLFTGKGEDVFIFVFAFIFSSSLLTVMAVAWPLIEMVGQSFYREFIYQPK